MNRRTITATAVALVTLVSTVLLPAGTALPAFRDVPGSGLYRGLAPADGLELLAITDAEELAELFEGRLGLSTPSVDFDQRVVIAVLSEANPCDFQIRSVRTSTVGPELTKIDVFGAIQAPQICPYTASAHVIQLEKFSGRVTFHDATTQIPVGTLEIEEEAP